MYLHRAIMFIVNNMIFIFNKPPHFVTTFFKPSLINHEL